MWSVTFIAFLCVSHLTGIRTEYEDLLTKFKILEDNLLSALETHVQQINSLEAIVKKQQDTLSDQEKRIKQQQETLTEQEKTIIQQQQALIEQQELYKTLQNLYNEQAETLKRHEDILGTQSARIVSLEKDTDLSRMEARTGNTSGGPVVDYTKHKTEAYRDNNVVRRRSSPSITTPVAFTAVKQATQGEIGINQNIIFEKVILNDGGGFHALHSIFITPVAGYYLFSTSTLHTMAIPNYLYAGIMHNGNLIAVAHSHRDIYDQGSVTVVLKLAVGDEVWISNRFHGSESVEGYSSFCGVLL